MLDFFLNFPCARSRSIHASGFLGSSACVTTLYPSAPYNSAFDESETLRSQPVPNTVELGDGCDNGHGRRVGAVCTATHRDAVNIVGRTLYPSTACAGQTEITPRVATSVDGLTCRMLRWFYLGANAAGKSLIRQPAKSHA